MEALMGPSFSGDLASATEWEEGAPGGEDDAVVVFRLVVDEAEEVPPLHTEEDLESLVERMLYAVVDIGPLSDKCQGLSYTVSLEKLPSFVRAFADRMWIMNNVQYQYLVVLHYFQTYDVGDDMESIWLEICSSRNLRDPILLDALLRLGKNDENPVSRSFEEICEKRTVEIQKHLEY
eukprot:TRINITY_DN9563_c0_g1_i1.p1 TRINITY_DN9563_c0_g1~~TRINITY_DN9563_c0_g1_i1.p1  ORF type:complete len:189 (+),score=33.82 TRINITY_DN9563_c0_g1_i1:36-569(+)